MRSGRKRHAMYTRSRLSGKWMASDGLFAGRAGWEGDKGKVGGIGRPWAGDERRRRGGQELGACGGDEGKKRAFGGGLGSRPASLRPSCCGLLFDVPRCRSPQSVLHRTHRSARHAPSLVFLPSPSLPTKPFINVRSPPPPIFSPSLPSALTETRSPRPLLLTRPPAYTSSPSWIRHQRRLVGAFALLLLFAVIPNTLPMSYCFSTPLTRLLSPIAFTARAAA